MTFVKGEFEAKVSNMELMSAGADRGCGYEKISYGRTGQVEKQ